MPKKSRQAQRRQRSDLDPRVTELATIFLDAAKELKLPYAIGGALAMAAHGYHRQTRDVDAFVQYEDRGKWIRALRERGLRVEPMFAGVQYAAVLPKHRNTEIRIDLLVPAEDPDLSALEFPDTARIAGRTAEVWPVVLLVIAKYRSEREKDQADVVEMSERGMFDPREVRTVMLHMDEPDLARSFWQTFGGAQ